MAVSWAILGPTMTPASRTWRWPEIRRRPALLLLAGFLLLGLWQGSTVLLAMRADHDATPWREPFLWELTGALAGWVTFWIPVTAVLNTRRPLRPGPFLALHLGALLVFAAAKDTLMIGLRFLAYPVLGWGTYHYAFRPEHLGMEFMKDGLAYGLICGGYALARAWRERQALALRQSELEGRLKEARLQALLGQLNPHFLFNALNTVSSLMYEDLARTDRFLSDLGQVLRAGFEGDRPTWTLAEERAHTERFLALLAARFGDRVRVDWEVAPGLERAPVPRFALQLLAENAVKHNQDRPGPLVLRLRARRGPEGLELEAEDDGRGFGDVSPARGAGLGLRHLEEALRLLHGDQARLERGTGPEGGARVRLVLPEGD